MTDWTNILFKAFFCSCAATGFGILFNTPARVLFYVVFGGFLAGLVKFTLMESAISSGIILGTFAASTTVGAVSIPIALRRHVPSIIFTIPSVVPLIPGAFAYRTMLGLMKLTRVIDDEYSRVLAETVRNGVMTLFVVMAIAIGAVIPMFLFRRREMLK